MASKVDICNMALSRLGSATIVSLGDGTQEAILCNTFFDVVARRVIRMGSWSSAIRRSSINRTLTTPAFGYTYEYQLPVDPECLRVLDVNGVTPGDIDYRIEGDKLLTDESSIKIKYLAYLTDTEDYDAGLEECIEVMLASYLAKPLTGKDNVAANLKQEFQQLLRLHLSIDGQQGSKDSLIADDLIRIR